jgi:hypothetical protein
MTGVAAGLTERRAFLSDLSPAAVHIASNYTTPCNPAGFQDAVNRVLVKVGEQVGALYRSEHRGAEATVEYLVWSDVRTCPACGVKQSMWAHRAAGLRRITCLECGEESAKASMPVVGEVPVEANLSQEGRPRVVRAPMCADLGLDQLPSTMPWHPRHAFDSSRPMWRRGHEDLGIATVADFYSQRNLSAMGLLWEAASQESDERLRSALRFSLTAIADRASRRYQWNAKRPTNVLGGTLYVSSLRYEWNVLSLWRRKTAAVGRLFAANSVPAGAVEVRQGDAARLPLASDSVDYCFTDPPFGGHIVYADSSLLWESWLDDLTDSEAEAIVVRSGGTPKSVARYRALLTAGFAEVSRVLKPGRFTTVVFQSTDPAIWKAIQEATRDAGFSLVDATTLEKGQPSFKQVKGQVEGERVATSDVVLTLHNGRTHTPQIESSPLEVVRTSILETTAAGRRATTGHLFASVNARLLRDGHSQVLGFEEVNALLEENFDRSDDGWVVA